MSQQNLQQQQQGAAVVAAGMVQQAGGEPQQVLHVKQDSGKDMEQLFSVLENNQPTSRPLRERNFPPSFWTPPKVSAQFSAVSSSQGYGKPVGSGLCG